VESTSLFGNLLQKETSENGESFSWREKDADNLIAQININNQTQTIRFRADDKISSHLDEWVEDEKVGSKMIEELKKDGKYRVFDIHSPHNWNLAARDFVTTIEGWLGELYG